MDRRKKEKEWSQLVSEEQKKLKEISGWRKWKIRDRNHMIGKKK